MSVCHTVFVLFVLGVGQRTFETNWLSYIQSFLFFFSVLVLLLCSLCHMHILLC